MMLHVQALTFFLRCGVDVLSCSYSAEPAGGTSEWHESRCDTTAQHAVQDPAGVGPPADVWEEHPEPSHQPRERASTAAGELGHSEQEGRGGFRKLF